MYSRPSSELEMVLPRMSVIPSGQQRHFFTASNDVIAGRKVWSARILTAMKLRGVKKTVAMVKTPMNMFSVFALSVSRSEAEFISCTKSITRAWEGAEGTYSVS
jgi:hypothetical protein